ncbi:rhomboid family intramembrane serine protease [Teredinibacter turnerae]|uniref:rhomboid family intramembrane serine protease n=1 Tax=Teredinibacter turnerae TaxID=2426 RepID=UPI0003682377|nr:rhomboid family intramembrane serine protease [Teredinibacter turnerae]
MNWIKAAEFPAAESLQGLNNYLTTHNVAHRFTEERGCQVLWLAHPADAVWVERYFNGDANVELATDKETIEQQRFAANNQARDQIGFADSLRIFPFTLATIVLGLCGYLYITYIWPTGLPDYFFMQPLNELRQTHQWWRLLTPAFLHFGVMHALFNCLWIWELGRRIEVFTGRKSTVVLFLISAIGANLVQYFSGGGSVQFGGLSGVVYAYLGYLLVWTRVSDHPLIKIPPGIFVFMLVWLALGYLGIIDLLFSTSLANGAHLGGLVAGILFAAAQYFFIVRRSRTGEP